MNFDKFFKFISYAVVFCGFLALWISGGSGLVVSVLFLAVFIAALFSEDSRLLISERVGTVLMIFVISLFYVDWKYRLTGFQSTETAIAGTLAKLILLLTAIKLFQKKGDRDWLFLYLMSFFEVLLAAGVSVSPSFLASLILYLLAAICAIITFEIRKTSRFVSSKSAQKSNSAVEKIDVKSKLIKRLPATAVVLLVLIIAVAAPLFFTLPRVGSAAGAGNKKNNASSVVGFSDSVTLGEIGKLKQSDQIVMRARIENAKENNLNATRWRGASLDTFDNRSWSRAVEGVKEIRNDNGTFNFDKTDRAENITVQTVYLEPFDPPVLFVLSRPLAVQQGKISRLYQDANKALTFSRNDFDRLIYKVYSDTALPKSDRLRADNGVYSPDYQRFLQLPENIDERIRQLAAQVTENETNRYDKAKVLEKYLQTQFGYTLNLRASGEQPLADFLFNIREGHCEYFASALAIMLRTQGVATRIVNGFQRGEYNETADVFVVKQKNAHSWVEVYFPKENVWVPFDPTPFAGQNESLNEGGIFGSLNKYLEALETFWIQYFVAYDNQEQRSLFRSVKNSFQNYQTKSSVWLNELQYKIGDWWREARGDKGLQTSAKAIFYVLGWLLGIVLGIFLIVWLYRKIVKLKIWQNALARLKRRNEATIIEFYERMQEVLASKGFTRLSHQTPLEFAFGLNMPEAVKITEKYNRVRFGEKNLSENEARQIEDWLRKLETID